MNEQINIEIEKFLNSKIKSKDVINLFYKIGAILTENKASYYQLIILDSYLRKKYGLVISLSKKNLIKIEKFYKMCNHIDINKLNKVDWNSYLIIINKKNYEELIDMYIKEKLNKRELEYYMKTGKKLHITMNYDDPATIEFLKLQESLIKNPK